ncbi:MAG: hypothetical protein GX410_01380, partial [Elusimicrobia bacterium]|nr:hypothetical protein [Elusimicrobiota bacterium]
FADAIKAGVDAIMTAHVLYKNLDPDNPATFSRRILTDLLRNELGFNGIIFSDSLDMKGASGKSSVEKAAVRAKKAGADALLIGGGDPEAVLAALKKEFGENDKAMAKSAEAVMALKEKLGLFSPRPEASPAVDMAYQSTARAIAEKSVTLAWDKEALIPLPKPASGAKKPKLCGVFFCPPRYSYDLLEINTPLLEDGWDVEHYNAPMTPAQDDIARAKACAERSDALLIGTFQWAAQPYKTQLKAVRELLRLKKPTVLISMMSPYDILLYRDAPAALVTYGANRFSMQAAGEILSGKLPPEGELPFRLDSPASKP